MSISERLDSHAEAWRPEPGDKVIGTVVSVEMFAGTYGDYPLLLVAQDDGAEVAIHAFHTVLRSELARKQPQPGDRIGLKYVGKSDKGYEAYTVVTESARPTAIDWEAIPSARTVHNEPPTGDGPREEWQSPPDEWVPPFDDEVPA